MTFENDPHAGRSIGRYMGLEQREVGDWEAGDIRIVASGEIGDHLRDPTGSLRTGALLTMCDNAAGFTGGLASLPDGWVVSTNLHLRRFATQVVGPIRIDTRVLRRGRKAVVTGAEVFDDGADDERIADCVLTGAVLVPADGPPTWERPAYLPNEQAHDAVPLLDAFGISSAVDGSRDEVTLEVSDELRNPWGIVHGGVTATLVDVAAERAANPDRRDAATLTTDVTLRYLAPGRDGPLRARTELLVERPDGRVVRVEVTDEGHQSRTVAVATATVRVVG